VSGKSYVLRVWPLLYSYAPNNPINLQINTILPELEDNEQR